MAKASTAAASRPKLGVKYEETRKEINKQQELLSTDVDKKSLKGNVTVEDWRYVKHRQNLSKKEKRQQFEIKNQKTELLKDLKKVRSNYTGHYDESKSPIENIQQALRAKCMTPARSSRLDVPALTPVRRCKSQESILVDHRPRSTLSYSQRPGYLGSAPCRLPKRPETVHSMRPVKLQSPELTRKSGGDAAKKPGKKAGVAKTIEGKTARVKDGS